MIQDYKYASNFGSDELKGNVELFYRQKHLLRNEGAK